MSGLPWWIASALLVASIIASGCTAPPAAEQDFPGQWSDEQDRFVVRSGVQCREHPWTDSSTSLPPPAEMWLLHANRTRELSAFLASQGIDHGEHGVVQTGAPVYGACNLPDDWTYWYEPRGVPPLHGWEPHEGQWWALRATYCDTPGWPTERQHLETWTEPSPDDAERVSDWLSQQGAGNVEVHASLIGAPPRDICGAPAPMVYWVRMESGSLTAPWWPVATSPGV